MENYMHLVQYYETDRMDCVHHSNYIRWFEEARCFFLEKLGFSYERMEESGVLSPVLKVQAEYISMARFAETVEIETRVSEYTGTRISFSYKIRDVESGKMRCQGQTSHCFISDSGRPVSLKKALPALHELVKNDF